MIDILGKKYLTDKEASERYGYSQRWFIQQRQLSKGPKYFQLKGTKGRVLYPLIETDKWFKDNLEEK